jgi:hypothetical protein
VGADCARIDQRGAHAEFANMPGGTTGLPAKGKEADTPVYGVDTVSSLNCALARRFGPLYDKPTYPANRDARASII